MALSFKPGDQYQLDPNQGAWLNNQIYPPGVYDIRAYGAKGGNGQCGAIGGNGGYVHLKFRMYMEKKFYFYLGIMGGIGAIQKGGCQVFPQGGTPANAYSYGGHGGYDILGTSEYGGGGGAHTEMVVYHYPNYSSGAVLFHVGGGGGAGGWRDCANARGGPGGYLYTASESVSKTNPVTTYNRGQDGRSAFDGYSSGEGGGGGGYYGGGIKDMYEANGEGTGSWVGGGGYGGRSKLPNNNIQDMYIEVSEYGVGYNGWHGYIVLRYVDYIWYTIYAYNCKELDSTKAIEGTWITCIADIEYEQYNESGKLFRCHSSYGIFKDITYNNINNQTISEDGTQITFQMKRSDAYIYANFYKLSISCTRCWYSSDNGDKVILPGNTYRIKASETYGGKKFIGFVTSGINKITNNVQWVSRTEFTFVMPESSVSVTAMYFDRLNTDLYKNPCAQEPFDRQILPFKE